MSSRRIEAVDIFALEAPLTECFSTTKATVSALRNLAVRLILDDNTSGWGEIPVFHPLTPETQDSAYALACRLSPGLIGRSVNAWRRISSDLAEQACDHKSVLCGFETAMLDAFTRSLNIPLFEFFGGSSKQLQTDMTIPICAPEHALDLARRYRAAGFSTLKIKIGTDADSDAKRIIAAHSAHPEAGLIVDANAGYSVESVLHLLTELRRFNIEPTMLEQPVARENIEGLAKLVREADVLIAADESCRTAHDVLALAKSSAAHVINIKIAKSGVLEALDMIAAAKGVGLGLMIGGMVESRLAMSASAHIAAGLGCFDWIDLDTPLLLARDPIKGGALLQGPRYLLQPEVAGHGAMLVEKT